MDIVFNSLLVHHILSREVESSRPDSMTFDLNGTIVEFSKEDFLLVTGLWWSSIKLVRSVEVMESLQLKYFKNLMTIEVHPTKFKECYKMLEFENDLDVVKISLVHYYVLGLIGKGKIKSSINKSLLDDVKDLEYFNSLNWGYILCERTFNGLKKVLKDKVTSYKENVWANEIISSIAGRTAVQLNNNVVP
ncbi:uncharacterized protein LOC120089133 [Benincasa hispida]|uniref:uncharacterized protein LOC120089133 n=1 Tax=Benincasa hispida TaxID=102211 RepID=UPI001900FE73|nr:uncharacterized protein LOC120089133 [Benincasa hispida]